MKVICVATKENGYYKNLKESSRRYNYELVPLGLGMKWGGFTMKFDLMRKYLQTLENDNIVIFVDAYDVFINNNSNYIYEAFKEFNKPKKQYYKVRKGDTLSEIAEKHKMSLSKLKRLNNLKSNMIRIGQKLRVR